MAKDKNRTISSYNFNGVSEAPGKGISGSDGFANLGNSSARTIVGWLLVMLDPGLVLGAALSAVLPLRRHEKINCAWRRHEIVRTIFSSF